MRKAKQNGYTRLDSIITFELKYYNLLWRSSYFKGKGLKQKPKENNTDRLTVVRAPA